MSEWHAKRFWQDAAVTERSGGFSVALDGRAVKTPAKADLVVPTQALAQEIASEWQAQDGRIVPASMPVTCAANAAIDKVAHQHAEVAQLIAAYGDADLLCYRADSPAELVARQRELWDPLLGWAASALGADLKTVTGVIHVPQEPAVLARLSSMVHALDTFELTAFHDLVSLSGSLVLGFAAIQDLKPPQILWQLSRVDEIWQEEQWGVDEEAQDQIVKKESDFLNAKRFFDLSRRPI